MSSKRKIIKGGDPKHITNTNNGEIHSPEQTKEPNQVLHPEKNVRIKDGNILQEFRTEVKQSGGQTIGIKMEGNNYDYDSAVKAIEQVISYVHLNKKVSRGDPKTYIWSSADRLFAQHPMGSRSHVSNFVNIINKQWNSGVVLKTVDLETKTTSYTTIKYENLYRKEQKEESDTGIKTSILRLFFHLSIKKTNIVEFSPILVKQYYGGVSGGAPYNPTVVSDDYRRTILSVTQMNPSSEDTHYILKMTSNDYYIESYKHEAKIYEFLNKEELVKPHIVRYYGSGDYEYDYKNSNLQLKGELFTLSSEQWNAVIVNTVDLDMEKGFYILLENTLGYRDYEDFVQLNHASLNNSFKNIYSALDTLKSKADFFHGDFHRQNVKINYAYVVKLFDFDFSCIIPSGVEKPKYISQNIEQYRLKYEGKLLFPENAHKNAQHLEFKADMKLFLFWFDIFRLWLSTKISLKKMSKNFNLNVLATHTHTPTAPFVILNTYLSKYKDWYERTENNNQWHEYFEDSYFYDNIYIWSPQRDQGTDNVQQAPPPRNFLNYPEPSSQQFGGNRKAIPKTNYKKHGKYDVVINDVKLKMRVIWKHNRQFYIKRWDGSFEKINKKSIHS